MFRALLLKKSLLLGVFLIYPASAAERPLSVCETLSNLRFYRGKVITITGILGGGTRHGWILKDRLDDEPCRNLEAQGRTWPAAIVLAEYTNGSDLEDGPADFESETMQIESLLSEPKKIIQGRADLVIAATFVGQLRSRKGVNIQRSKDGWYVGDGYGQSGQYPALLVLKRAREVRVIAKPRSK